MAQAEVRGTFSQPGPSHPAVGVRLAPTLGLIATFFMPPPDQKSKAAITLVTALRERAACLPPEASEAATLLSKHASEIENPARTEEALNNFNELAIHYKGLQDLIVPGTTDAEWLRFVEQARSMSKVAMRAKGQDKTFLGRVHSLFHARSK